MKTWTKTLFVIALSLMCLFTCLGYAALSDNLLINGSVSVEAKPYEGIYITNVRVYQSSGLTYIAPEYSMPTNLRSTVHVNQSNATITYEITVHNNTDITYWYNGIDSLDEISSNGLIDMPNGISIITMDHAGNSTATFDTDDWVPPQTERTFYATYRFGTNAQGDVSTFVNFKFGQRLGSLEDGFLTVLNDHPNGRYDILADAFNDTYSKDGGNTILSNVGTGKEILDSLLGEDLTVTIDGEEKCVSLTVQRLGIDGVSGTGDAYAPTGPSGCEYTLYLRIENTNTVYAVSYSCDSLGNWYQLGEFYEGTAEIAPDGTVIVETWRATPKEYTIISGVTYMVARNDGQGQPYDKYTTIQELMNQQHTDTEFTNKVDQVRSQFLEAICQIVYTRTNVNGTWVERENAANVAKPGYADLKKAFDDFKPFCNITNEHSVQMMNNQAPRARIIRMLEDLAEAYEFYLAVNPNG